MCLNILLLILNLNSIIDNLSNMLLEEREVIIAKGEDHPQNHPDRHTDPRLALQLYKGGGMSLVKLTKEIVSSIHLNDIPENNPLHAQLQAYLSQKQSDTFASVTKEEGDDIKSYEKVSKKEMIFLLENFDIQRKEEPWKIFQRYLVNGLYFPESHTNPNLLFRLQHNENVYNFSKMIIKQIILVEDWGISTMKERQISLNKVSMNFTYWDYIHAFDKVLIYNTERHKHTWFIKDCAKIFAEPIPNWFLN
ncbi:hypothetical protein H5410_002369 [Solanum commersonii]|uniref:Uncharacterized protein n=1 Tax=Solanum commersonii TaxID=4109 RepID=A0A9J6B1X3_SOLCO|nr:hypothetical protein H5410_002369 [Solanum commersonii]